MKFSVIVPVYRTKEYLERCVQSVLNQSQGDFELILVDDCCPDGCGKLCDEFAAQDSRIRVIHKPENEGLGRARNTGLEAAQGDFILFLDSDDWVDSRLLERCSALPEQDILIFGTTFCYEKSGKEEVRLPEAATAQTQKEKADVFAMLTRARIFQFAWNKLYRRAFLMDSGVRFESTPLIEDFLFNMALLPKADTVACIPQALHIYRRPVHETLAGKYNEAFFSLCKRKYTLEADFLKASGAEEYTGIICQSFIKHLLSSGVRNAAHLTRKEQKLAMAAMLADPVTAAAMDAYAPAQPHYRLLKRLICRRRTVLLLTMCRMFGKISNH